MMIFLTPMFPGQGVDPMEYDIEEEYEARIDSQALARLEPDVRSKIDPSFLGKIAHANPRVLAEVGHWLDTPSHNTHTHNCAITSHPTVTRHTRLHTTSPQMYHTHTHTSTHHQIYLVASPDLIQHVYR